MNTPPVRVERRVGQRFPYLLPVSLRDSSGSIQGSGFTQDLSSRGVFLFTDAPIHEGIEIDLTLQMPSEITLGENMRVRCHGRVLRVMKSGAAYHNSADSSRAESRIGVAVRFDNYEYLPESAESCSVGRIAALHDRDDENLSLAPASDRTS